MRLRETGTLSLLDFDLENRPLSYLGSDFTTAEITAIAASWVGDRKVHCWLLTADRDSSMEMLSGFMELYEQADIVTGHNIRRHDLPILNGALLEAGLPQMRAKMSQDTYADLKRRQGVSASQESLAAMLGVPAPKRHMTQVDWREANRLTDEGLSRTRERVIGDVIQHKHLREELLRIGWLKPPRVWAP